MTTVAVLGGGRIGEALLGRTVGDEIDVNVPRGVIKLKILKID